MLKEHKIQLATGVIVFILAFLIAIQFKSVTVHKEENSLKNARTEDLLLAIQKEQAKREDLEKQVEAYQNDIAQYRKDAEQTSGYSSFLSEQLKRAELLAGLSDVEGPGITITLNDADNRKATDSLISSADTLIHDEDLRRVINELCSADAEAIAVNDSRIISTTAIRCVGPTILVNDTKMTPPYVITAIGKADQLEAAMNLNGGVIDSLKVWGFSIKMNKSNKVTIPKYSGTVIFSSATPVNTEGATE